MANFNYTDLYILYEGHPKYNSIEVITDDHVRFVLQKYEMILFTNKGELISDLDFGADILKFLFQTNVSADYVKKEISHQIDTYIPEMSNFNYDLDVFFQQKEGDFSDMMFISLRLGEYEVNNYFG